MGGSKLFKPIFQSVDKQMESFRTHLFSRLNLSEEKDPLGRKLLTEEREHVIGYLYSIDAKEDPALFFLTEMASLLQKMLLSSQSVTSDINKSVSLIKYCISLYIILVEQLAKLWKRNCLIFGNWQAII